MEFKRECGRCHVTLNNDGLAYVCAHECTYCPTCVRRLAFVCPNCRGELVRRPRQPGSRTAALGTDRREAREIAVRRAALADLDALAPLFEAYRQFYEQPADPRGARQFLADRLSRNESVVFVAEVERLAVGFTLLYPLFTSLSLGPVLVLNDLFVVPAARNLGVGGALLEAARAHGLEVGAHYLELSTAVDNPAQRLYEGQGWAPDREFLHYELPLPRRARSE